MRKGKSTIVQQNAKMRMLENKSEGSENGVPRATGNTKSTRCTSNYVKMAGTAPILPGSLCELKNAAEPTIFDPKLDSESRDTDASSDVQSQNYREKKILSDERSESTDYVNYDEIDEVDFKSDISHARHLAERGPLLLQIVTFFGGLGMVVSSVADFQLTWNTKDAMDAGFATISIYTWLFGILIMGLEGRSVLLDVGSLHTAVSNYMKIFRFVWGRGLFLMFAGSLQCSLGSSISFVYGAFIISLGFVLFVCGIICKAIFNARTRDNGVKSKFDFFDSDLDGHITLEQFRDFAIFLKIQDFEEIEYDEEFLNIDTDNDGLVTFLEVKTWIDAVRYRKDLIMAMFEKASDYIV